MPNSTGGSPRPPRAFGVGTSKPAARRRALQLNGALSRRLLQQLPEGALVMRAHDSCICLANAAAHEILGFDPEGRLASDDVLQFRGAGGAPLPAEEQPLFKALSTPHGQSQELSLTAADGEQVSLLVNTAPIHTSDGRVVGSIALFQDITQRKAQERLRDDFLSVAGHELRTPMASLKGWGQYAQMRLARGEPSDPVTLVGNLNRQIAKLEVLLDQLLDTAQLETEGLQLDETEFDVRDCIEAAIQSLPPDWVQRVLFRRGRPVLVRGDRPRLERVFLNLLTNGLKYSSPESPVRLLTLTQPERLLVVVGDRGIGIPGQDLPHVFDRFYRAQNSSHSAGLGLGLYICKQVVEKHGGHLRVASQEQRGTVFSFDLPLATRHSAPGDARVRETVSPGPALPGLPEIPPRE